MSEKNKVKLSDEQKQRINDALVEGNTKHLFRLLAKYLRENDFSVQDAASVLITSRCNELKM